MERLSDAAKCLAADLGEFLLGYFPSAIQPVREQDYLTWSFPVATGADYQFQATVYDDGDPHILGARLLTEPEAYFWYRRFESPDFDDDAERHQEFLAAVGFLVASHTRVVVRSRLLSCSFGLEVSEEAEWRSFSTAIALRTTFNFPKLKRGKTIFVSPPLVPLSAP